MTNHARPSSVVASLLVLLVIGPASLACSASGSVAEPNPTGQAGNAGASGAAGLAGSAGRSGNAGAGAAGKAGNGGQAAGGQAGSANGGGGSGLGGGGSGGAAGNDIGCGDSEVCGNGVDDDCDGVVDENCLCVPGQTASCFRGTAQQRGQGVCRDGLMRCTGPQEFGEWQPCEGDTLPGAEVCDTGLLDENCNGTANESCECDDDSPPVACGSAVGECKTGLQTCVGGKLSACAGSVDPGVEQCDGKDNDCDGEVDENLTRPCGESKGICSLGIQTCVDGEYGACVGAVLPTDEVCNSLDDNCDGQVDEAVVVACGTAEGACKIGLQSCQDGLLGVCEGSVGATVEICNGIDDDCDGQVDEGLDVACGTDQGACSPGVSKCVGGVYTACQGAVGPTKEICDTIDNDCDGTVDQGCGCVVGSPPVACGSNVGACKPGTQSCVGGALGPCVGAVLPLVEVCNNIDDDCDGTVDESVTRACGSNIGACKQGVETCAAGAFGVCVGAVGPVEEICNGLDDDCDGEVDEGLVRGCGTDVGRCIAGVQICQKGAYGACLGGTLPIAEICDGAVDEDCDGVVDNGCACVAGSTIACGKNVGACKPGTQTCGADGKYGACVGATAPSAELCDSVDNDCDGQVDEDCGCSAGETRPCGSNVGLCSFGKETCSLAGTWGTCIGGKGPTVELCDGLDSNCDGDVDSTCLCLNGEKQDCGSSLGVCTRGQRTCNLQGAFGDCVGGVSESPETCNGLDDDCNGKVDDITPACPTAPSVTCEAPKTGIVGTAIALAPQASTAGGDPLTFQWTRQAAPSGSTAQPTPVGTQSTSFTPDLPGTYVLRFCATNGGGTAACCDTELTVTSDCTAPPTKPVIESCGTSWDRRPIVTFAPVPDKVVYQIWKQGDAAPIGSTTVAGQNYFRPENPIGAGGPPPGTDAGLFVKACKADNLTCCTQSDVVQAKLVEACSTVIAPTPENVVISEYIVAGQQGTQGTPQFQAAESIEITNLSHCPVSLAGHHFGYQNDGNTHRWMNFTPNDIIPPRGVYVTIRNRDAINPDKCALPFFGPDDPKLFGLKISPLAMEGAMLDGGWFNNTGGGKSVLRVATGAWVSITGGSPISEIKPYQKTNASCVGVGYEAKEACGDFAPGSALVTLGTVGSSQPNQLGRLWHPCDRVKNPVPVDCKLVNLVC